MEDTGARFAASAAEVTQEGPSPTPAPIFHAISIVGAVLDDMAEDLHDGLNYLVAVRGSDQKASLELFRDDRLLPMPDENESFSATETLAQLQNSRSSLPWPKRQELAEQLHPELATDWPSDAALALVELLAVDPKPEVRRAIATVLHLLPLDRYEPLRTHLEQDSDAGVR